MSFYCNDCGEYFDNPTTVKESQGEYWGAPAYEAFAACPNCNSIDIEEASRCMVCGEPTRAGEDFCKNCLKDLQHEVEGIQEHYKIDGPIMQEWIAELYGW